MKALKIVGIVLIVLIGLPLVAGLFMPKDFQVESSTTIQAPQPLVMENIRSLRRMNDWSPWAEQDPTMQVTYTGTDGTVGSSSAWKGQKAGTGRQSITLVNESRVETLVEFIEPMEGKGDAYLVTEPDAGGTKVTWGMKWSDPYPMNVLTSFMTGMIKKDFDAGLAKLKKITEAQAANNASTGSQP